MFASAMDWLSGNYGLVNSETSRRARRVAGVIILGLLGFTLTGIIWLAIGQWQMPIAPFLAVPALLVCGIALRTAASIDVIAHVLIAIVAAVLFGILMVTGGESVGALIAIPLVPGLAALIGSRRSVWFWSVMTILTIVVVLALTWLDFAFPVQPDLRQVTVAKFFVTIVVVGIVLGVTRLFIGEQQYAEQALLESDHVFKQAAQIANLGHYAWDNLGNKRIFASEEYARILGLSEIDVLTRFNTVEKTLGLIHPDDREQVLTTYAEGKNLGKGHDITYRIIRPDGVERHVREIESPLVGHQDRFMQTVGILQDITEQTRALKELEESERLLHQAVRTAKLGHWTVDAVTGKYLSVSEEYARIFGYTVDEFLSRYPTMEQDLELAHPEDRAKVVEAYGKGLVQDIEYRIVHADGSIRTVLENERSGPDGLATNGTYEGTLQDITELRRIQGRTRELQETQQELTKNLAEARRAAQLVKLGTYVWDWKELRLEACSEEYARIHEMSVDEALQTFNSLEADYNFVHPDDRDRIATLEAEAVADRGDYSATYRLLLPSGRVSHIREACEIEYDEQGGVCRTLGSVQDVTEQVELEDQLRQARKMEAVGQLTSGLAHDFNNSLAVVMGNLELAIECSNEDSGKQEYLEEAMRGAQKGADLNKQLLTLSRQQVLEERRLNVNEIIHDMSSLLARTLGEEIEIETVYSSKDCFSKLDPALFESAILSLAINARDAMTNGGKLRIETNVCPPQQAGQQLRHR